MSYTNGPSDRNTFEDDGTRCPGPGCTCSDCVDARKHFHESSGSVDVCIVCGQLFAMPNSDYCSRQCAIDSDNDR